MLCTFTQWETIHAHSHHGFWRCRCLCGWPLAGCGRRCRIHRPRRAPCGPAERWVALESPVHPLHLATVNAVQEPSAVGPVDLIVFAVKLGDTETAARQLAPMIGPETRILTLQNGIDSVAMITPHVGTASPTDPAQKPALFALSSAAADSAGTRLPRKAVEGLAFMWGWDQQRIPPCVRPGRSPRSETARSAAAPPSCTQCPVALTGSAALASRCSETRHGQRRS
jgi:Ketopantoate reductase PanE/ApbA